MALQKMLGQKKVFQIQPKSSQVTSTDHNRMFLNQIKCFYSNKMFYPDLKTLRYHNHKNTLKIKREIIKYEFFRSI